ncbi:ankyrin repeat domain-containing protein [Azohydromonas aeria]|uniref:ankyrin repeat domain-containing protein n=1 Tax=Azohydromonas aeria TaxID=2590212 RepID=UPI001E3FFAE6|nr:ankyrin repeat domain-containing protein [Azohydromonas aeria]
MAEPGAGRRRCLGAGLAAGLWLLAGPARAGIYEDFFKAVERDDGLTVARLLKRGFDPNSRDEHGQPALTLAFKEDALKAAEALWAHPQLDLEATNSADETPLMMAALRGHVAWMQRLLQRGARVHREGWAPIHYAATCPEPEPVEVMLKAGAPVNALSTNGSTPLMMAAGYGAIDAARFLLRHGADAKARNQRQLTAADFARTAGRDGLAAELDAAARR